MSEGKPQEIETVTDFRALLATKIVIQSDADFTPPGKRSARVVQCTRSRQLRWYVSGRLYRQLAPTAENMAMTREWMAAQK